MLKINDFSRLALVLLVTCFLFQPHFTYARGSTQRHKKRNARTYSYVVRGKRYTVMSKTAAHHYSKIGTASWYSRNDAGRITASGARFNMYALTAASKELPLGTRVRVTNLKNHKSVIVKINDRGPFIRGRIIDLSYAAAKRIGYKNSGTAKVHVVALS